MTKFEEIRTDLAAEHHALEGVLVRLADAQWDLQSHAPGPRGRPDRRACRGGPPIVLLQPAL
jgi:hypothetical protein